MGVAEHPVLPPGWSAAGTAATPYGLRFAFAVLVIAYWLLLFPFNPATRPEDDAVLYALTLAPVVLFFGYAVVNLFAASGRVGAAGGLALAFVACAMAVSLARGDFGTLRAATLIGMLVFVVVHFELEPSRRLLAGLLIASVPLGFLSFVAGTSFYGPLPGMSLESAEQGLEWRVSLFPALPESAFFSALMFAVALFDRRLPFRLGVLGVAMWFLVLGGVRSALLAALMCLGYRVVVGGSRERPVWLRATFVAAACTGFVLIIVMEQLVLLLPQLNNQFLNVFLFRSADAPLSEEAVGQTVFRGWLWVQHLSLFTSSPLAGVGTFELGDVAIDPLSSQTASTGSESFATFWLARLGAIGALLLAALVALATRAIRRRDDLAVCAAMILFVAMLAYGSFLVPYNFMFFVLVGALNWRAGTTFELRLPGARVGQ